MKIIRVSADEYEKIVIDRRVLFNEPRFTELNKDKVDDVLYLIIQKGNSPRFGLIMGRSGKNGKVPFSAPYSYPVPIRKMTEVESYDEALKAFENYCVDQGIEQIRFVFPPLIYDEDILTAWVSAMYRSGFDFENIDINYTLNLTKLNTEDYPQLLSKKSRSHLRHAKESGIKIIRCQTEEQEKTAYQIILENHTAKSRPTHMTFSQIKDTFGIVYHESFIAVLDEKPIASMIYYEITKDIVQCIYSGYLVEYTSSGVMNYLTEYAIHFFGDKGYKYIDRAISTEDSIPNYGLCNFKESVGGKRSLKYTLTKSLAQSPK